MGFLRRGEKVVDNAGNYIKATEAVSKPTAFLLSLLAFFVVFAVVFGAIIGGKWVWDEVINKDKKEAEVVQTDKSDQNKTTEESKNESQNKPGQSTGQTGQPAPSAPAPTPSPATVVGPSSNTSTPNTIPATGPDPNLP